MASLAELLSCLTIGDVMLRFLTALKSKSWHICMGSLTVDEVPLFEDYFMNGLWSGMIEVDFRHGYLSSPHHRKAVA